MDTYVYVPPLAYREPWLLPQLSERQQHRCCYCTLPTHLPDSLMNNWSNMATLEHVVPKSHGGCDCEVNLVMACRRCNKLRGRVNPLLFGKIIAHVFKYHPYLTTRWHDDTFDRNELWNDLRRRMKKIQIGRRPILL